METIETAQSREQTASGAFARFVLCGGGTGLASSFAVAGLASWLPWALANALITVASTLLATELHARFTFGASGRATCRQHAQSAGSAAAAYAVTCVAMLVLRQLVAAPDALLEQLVYLSASALAGVARFAVLRLVVFTRNTDRRERPPGSAPALGTRPAPSGPRPIRRPAHDRRSLGGPCCDGRTGIGWASPAVRGCVVGMSRSHAVQGPGRGARRRCGPAGLPVAVRAGTTPTGPRRPRRDEFIPLSDMLGLTSAVDEVDRTGPPTMTPGSVEGPFHSPAPPRPMGAWIADPPLLHRSAPSSPNDRGRKRSAMRA